MPDLQKEEEKEQKEQMCVCVFVAYITHLYGSLCCMYCVCCFVWQGITHQFSPHYCSGLKKS